jgi:hypothetical protein
VAASFFLAGWKLLLELYEEQEKQKQTEDV